jgi:hypothetical protein
MRKIAALVTVVAVVLLLQNAVLAAVHYVPDNFSSIQAALDGAKKGDSIIVRDGVWKGAANKNLDFKGKAVSLRSESGPKNCIIDCEGSGRGFYFHSGETYSSLIDGFTIKNAVTTYTGIFPNGWGAGIFCYVSSPTIKNCILTANQCVGTDDGSGAGIACYSYASPVISNCLIFGNSGVWGGAIYCNFSSAPTISNCTVTGNSARGGGGGIYTANGSWPLIVDSIFWDNQGTQGNEMEIVQNSDLTIRYSDVKGGAAAAYTGAGSILHWETGNINSTPLFAAGPQGAYYLSQTAAGQISNSPCVNAGSKTAGDAGLSSYATRTDHVNDSGTVDMGYHYWWGTQLAHVTLTSPQDATQVSAPPTFTWTADGGRDNSFAIDGSLSTGFASYWSTYDDGGQVLKGNSWTMPLSVWNRISPGTRMYWRVRATDSARQPRVIILSNQVRSFTKQ